MDSPSCVNNISNLAQATIKAASIAASAGTFGVGGILIHNSTGEIIHSISNAVIQKLQYTNINGDRLEGASFPSAHIAFHDLYFDGGKPLVFEFKWIYKIFYFKP